MQIRSSSVKDKLHQSIISGTTETTASTLESIEPIIKIPHSRRNKSALDFLPEYFPSPVPSRKISNRSERPISKSPITVVNDEMNDLFNTTCKLTDARTWKPIDPEREKSSPLKTPRKIIRQDKEVNRSVDDIEKISVYQPKRSKSPARASQPKIIKSRKIIRQDSFSSRSFAHNLEKITPRKPLLR